MSKSIYYFRRYRQSQDGATIPEEQNGGGTEWRRNGTEEEQNGTERSKGVLDDRIK